MPAKKILTYFIFFGISAALLFLTFKNTNFATIKENFYSLHWGFVGLCFLATMVSHFLRAWRWKLLLEPMGYKARLNTSFYAVMIGYLTNYAIPRGGELARCGVMFGTDKIPADKLLGTVVTERIIDVIMMMLIFVLTLFIEFDTINNFLQFGTLWEQHQNLIYILLATFLSGIVAIFVFMERISGFGFVQKIMAFLKGFNEGLVSVFKIKNQFLFWTQSIGIWVGFFFINYTFMHAMPVTEHLSWQVVLVVLAMGSVGFAIPTPGGTGSYHYIMKITLMFYLVSESDAAAYALVSHSMQAIFVAFVGSISLYLAFIERKKNTRNEPSANPA
jgi:uncharacterized protein (TIRG00374 family)